jgi:protein-disulfide isomerase
MNEEKKLEQEKNEEIQAENQMEIFLDDKEDLSVDDLGEDEKKYTENEKDKKIKNLISLAIVLGGLFIGSLFVDIIQLAQGGGFSQKALKQSDAISVGGKTWVAYNDPIVKVQIINDDTCENCKPDEALVGLRRVLPTMLTQKVAYDSKEGKALLDKFGIKTLPAFIFSKEIESVDLFTQAEGLFDKKDNQYALKTVELGMPAGKYVEAPTTAENDIKIGSDDAKVKIVEFTDFQCPYCKQLHETIMTQVAKDYGDKVQVIFKNLPLPIHPQANVASLAAICANEQGKFSEYADKLFATQDAWGKAKDATPLLKTYAAQLKLDTQKFNQCLTDKKYQSLIDQSSKQAQEFNIQGTPALFVGENFLPGMVKYDDVKKAIDEELAK